MHFLFYFFSSGYIQNVVYTRSQYRTQHYPTLSTRGQSVPHESLHYQKSFNGGLYNLPNQRTSVTSQSIVGLDGSSLVPSSSSQIHHHANHNPLSSTTPVAASGIASQSPQPPFQSLNSQYTPLHQHFRHHLYQLPQQNSAPQRSRKPTPEETENIERYYI